MLLAIAVALLLVVTLQRPRPKGPNLIRSCLQPAVALSADGSDGAIRYAITGPKAGTYVIAIDATGVNVTGQQVEATPAGARAISVRLGLPDCGSTGTLPTLPAGPHTVVLFRDGQRVASAPLPG